MVIEGYGTVSVSYKQGGRTPCSVNGTVFGGRAERKIKSTVPYHQSAQVSGAWFKLVLYTELMTSRRRSEEVRVAWTDHFSSPNAEGDDGQKVECSNML